MNLAVTFRNRLYSYKNNLCQYGHSVASLRYLYALIRFNTTPKLNPRPEGGSALCFTSQSSILISKFSIFGLLHHMLSNIHPIQKSRQIVHLHFVIAKSTECPKICCKSLLNLLQFTANLYLSRCSTHLRLIIGHSVTTFFVLVVIIKCFPQVEESKCKKNYNEKRGQKW